MPTFDAAQVLNAAFGPDPFGDRSEAVSFAVQLDDMMQRVASEPGVAGVSFVASLPGRTDAVEVEGAARTPTGHRVAPRGVAVGLLEMLGIDVVAGRSLTAADAETGVSTVLVSEAFVAQVLGGENALGRRIRFVQPDADPAADAPWFEIVGVVRNMSENRYNADLVRPAVFYAVSATSASSVTLAVRMNPGVSSADIAPRLAVHASAVDPALRLGRVRSMDAEDVQWQFVARLVALMVSLVLVSVLLLSAAGIYALMSFTVTQRRREIGIRAALGALPRHVLASVFSRATLQLCAGVAAGVGIAVLVDGLSGWDALHGRGPIIVPGIALLMLLAGAMAALGPARRGLRIEPSEALRSDA